MQRGNFYKEYSSYVRIEGEKTFNYGICQPTTSELKEKRFADLSRNFGKYIKESFAKEYLADLKKNSVKMGYEEFRIKYHYGEPEIIEMGNKIFVYLQTKKVENQITPTKKPWWKIF